MVMSMRPWAKDASHYFRVTANRRPRNCGRRWLSNQQRVISNLERTTQIRIRRCYHQLHRMYKNMADLQISTMAKYRKLLFIPSETEIMMYYH